MEISLIKLTAYIPICVYICAKKYLKEMFTKKLKIFVSRVGRFQEKFCFLFYFDFLQ